MWCSILPSSQLILVHSHSQPSACSPPQCWPAVCSLHGREGLLPGSTLQIHLAKAQVPR